MGTRTKGDILITAGKIDSEILDAFLLEADEVMKLVKLRSVLSVGASNEIRNKAETLLTQEIAKRLTTLSASLIEMFTVRNEKDKETKRNRT